MNESKTRSEYAGLEKRVIKSLSDEDVEILRKGSGRVFGGLGLLAELNNYPEPLHVLDYDKELNLTDGQRKKIQDIADEKQREAISIGEEFIAGEKHLNSHFANQAVSEIELKELISRNAEIFGRLRYSHLMAHLKTRAVLTQEQIKLYNKLAGYSK
jgi:hypothetical protein